MWTVSFLISGFFAWAFGAAGGLATIVCVVLAILKLAGVGHIHQGYLMLAAIPLGLYLASLVCFLVMAVCGEVAKG